MGWDRVFSQEEFLNFIIEVASTLLPWQEQDNCLDSLVQLSLELPFPCFRIHTTFDREYRRSGALITKLLQALFHSRSELLSNVGVSISMKDSPGLESRLLIHFVLDLSVDFSRTLFNVKGISVTTAFGTHDHIACLVLIPRQGTWGLLEFQVPKFLLLHTFGISTEDFEEVLAFVHLSVSIGVHNLSKILHQSKIGSHRICKTSYLTEFGNKSNLNSCLSVFVNEQWLIAIINCLIVSGLIVVPVGDLCQVNYCKNLLVFLTYRM